MALPNKFITPPMPWPNIAVINIIYRTLKGTSRLTTTEMPRGDVRWTDEEWIRETYMTDYVRANWLQIEVTQDSPWIRKRILSPYAKAVALITPKETDGD